MPQSQVSNAATIIQLLVACLTLCLGLVNAFFFMVLKRIKKNSDDLWSKINENKKRCDKDHDRITVIETKCNEKNKNGDVK